MVSDLAAVQADVQRLVLAGPGSEASHATHVLLGVTDAAAARRTLADLVDDASDARRYDASDVRRVKRRSTASPVSVTVGVTAPGLAALGWADDLATFPIEFRQGPHVRSRPLGDVGANDPAEWLPPFAASAADALHLVVIVWEPDGGEEVGRAVQRQLDAAGSGLVVHETYHGDKRPDGREPFGFVDGKRQPWIPGLRPSRERPPGVEDVALGEFVLGHPTQFGERRRWQVPGCGVEDGDRLGFNGSFAALRLMGQDVAAFTRWVGDHGRLAAEEMCGVRFDGEELAGGPPIDSHVGRANPRQRPLASRGHHTRRLLRRGVPGTWPVHGRCEAGLIGLFVCASLAAQYEGVLGEWMHHGIHDPRITGTNDRLVGYQGPHVTSFVRTRGVAYLFLPSRTALRRIMSEPAPVRTSAAVQAGG